MRDRVAAWRKGMASRPPVLRATGYVIAVVGTFAAVASLVPFRDETSTLPDALALLLVVVLAAWIGGIGPGVLASVAGSLAFDYFFLLPYGTFRIDRLDDIVVFLAFLGLSVLISGLVARTQDRAAAAEASQEQLLMLLSLSRELVLTTPGPKAYELLLRQLVATFGFEDATLALEESREYRGLHDTLTVDLEDHGSRDRAESDVEPRTEEKLVLAVGGRLLGLVILRGDRGSLDPTEAGIVRAFCDQLALLLERDRLLATAVRANTQLAGNRRD